MGQGFALLYKSFGQQFLEHFGILAETGGDVCPVRNGTAEYVFPVVTGKVTEGNEVGSVVEVAQRADNHCTDVEARKRKASAETMAGRSVCPSDWNSSQ